MMIVKNDVIPLIQCIILKPVDAICEFFLKFKSLGMYDVYPETLNFWSYMFT